MTKQEWIESITESAEGVGTYRPEYETIIDTLATILEQRDKAMEDYIKTGSHPVISHTNKGGATNLVKNPLLVMWSDLNKDALTYWRDLGLTPSGLRKLADNAVIVKTDEDSNLTKILNTIKEQ